jgi:hypothetical protein
MSLIETLGRMAFDTPSKHRANVIFRIGRFLSGHDTAEIEKGGLELLFAAHALAEDDEMGSITSGLFVTQFADRLRGAPTQFNAHLVNAALLEHEHFGTFEDFPDINLVRRSKDDERIELIYKDKVAKILFLGEDDVRFARGTITSKGLHAPMAYSYTSMNKVDGFDMAIQTAYEYLSS